MGVKATQVPAPAKIGSTYTPKQGYKFVMYNATVTNINATDRYVSGENFFTLQDSNNNAYSVSYATRDGSIAGFPNNVMTHPGDKVNGIIVFEVPQNAKLTTLVYDDHPSVGPYGGYAGNVTINLAGGSNAASSTTGSASAAPGAQSTSTPSGSPLSNPSLISQPTSSPDSSPTAIPTPTTTPAPTTTTKSVTIYAQRGCPYCEAAIADYTNQGYVVTVLYEGDPGFVPQASYPVIVDTSTGGY